MRQAPRGCKAKRPRAGQTKTLSNLLEIGVLPSEPAFDHRGNRTDRREWLSSFEFCL